MNLPEKILFHKNQLTALVLLIILICFCSSGELRRLDCRKYVFAPKCRGVAAKRDVMNSQSVPEDPRYQNVEDEFIILYFNPRNQWKPSVLNPKGRLSSLIKKQLPKETTFDMTNEN